MQTNGFEIDCELNYEVEEPSVFVFNIEAARLPGQRVLHEHLSTLPAIALDQYSGALGNRFTRLQALPGSLSVRYTASVSVDQMAPPTDHGLTSGQSQPR